MGLEEPVWRHGEGRVEKGHAKKTCFPKNTGQRRWCVGEVDVVDFDFVRWTGKNKTC
jgi:hypothetical protein